MSERGTTTNPLTSIEYVNYLFLRKVFALLPLDFLRACALLVLAEICEEVFGVFLLTRLVGRQNCFLFVFAPQAFPVLVSTHFSFSQRLSDLPFLVLRTLPLPFRHLAIACDALADGKTL